MKSTLLKSASLALLVNLSGFANAGLIEHTYSGPTGSNVDTDPASTFDIIISDDYLIESLTVQIELFSQPDLYWTDLDISITNGLDTVELAAGQDIFLGAEGLFKVSFDDIALNSLTTGDSIGAYRPMENLSVFDGQNIAGTWTLSILDDFMPNEGNELRGFSITATQVPEPTTLAIFALGLIALATRQFKKR